MKLIRRINLLVAEYSSPDRYGLRLYVAHRTAKGIVTGEPSEISSPQESKKQLVRFPLLLAVCGSGVITKESGEWMQRVVCDPERFLWSEDTEGSAKGDGLEMDKPGGEKVVKVSFVRRDQIEPLAGELKREGIIPAQTVCMDGSAQLDEILTWLASRFFTRQATFGALLRPEGQPLAAHLSRRLMMPVLLVLLVLLMANHFASNALAKKRQDQHLQLEALHRRQGESDRNARKRDQAAAQFTAALPRKYAWLCDRAAAALPAGLTLTQLAVQPCTKAPDEGKPAVVAQRGMVICGSGMESEDISGYVVALQGLRLPGDMRLASVEHDPRNGLFMFRIDIAL